MAQVNPRLLTFYLPQFHPIPENEHWWGKGFTEWTNVTKARPLFPGHYQPHVPADLGFYDLRLAEVRQAQADLAREYGIYGFCYYHYWFGGKRLLERPLDEVLNSGKPDFPFCLCWANEPWTRAWDGLSGKTLIEQNYSEEDDRTHIRWLARVFQDQRYVRIGDKPVMLIYRAGDLPNPLQTTCIWREEARKLEIGDLYLCRVESHAGDRTDPRELGFDAAVEFQPDGMNFGPPLTNPIYGDHDVYSYPLFVDLQIRKPDPPYKRFPCVTPSWDNSPRRQLRATILVGSTPLLFEMWLRTAVQKVSQNSGDENLVFVNAWNEWAEGNHLEPDLVFGRAYLEAIRRALHPDSDSDSRFALFQGVIADRRVYIDALEQEQRRLQRSYQELERWAHELDAMVQEHTRNAGTFRSLFGTVRSLGSKIIRRK